VADLQRLSLLEGSGGGSELTCQQLQNARLAGAVHPDEPDAIARPDRPVQLVEDHFLAGLKAHAMQIEDVLAQPGCREALQGKGIPRFRLVGDQVVGGLDPELRLRCPRRRSPSQPRQLLTHQVAPSSLGSGGDPHPFRAGQDVRRVSPVIGVHGAVVHFPSVGAHRVEEPAIMADDHERLGPLLGKVSGQPADHLDVEVVGRLVEHQHVVTGEQHRSERDAAPFTAAQVAHFTVERYFGQQILDDRPSVCLRRPDMVCTPADDHVAHRGVRAEVVGLVQVAHRQSRDVGNPAGVGVASAGQHLQQRGLAVAVTSNDPDRIALVDPEADGVEQRAGAVCDARALHIDQIRHRAR
jgi:hypothetical protein